MKSNIEQSTETSTLPENKIPTEIKFSTTFLVYLSELKEHKIIYLSFLLTIQRLLLQEAAKGDWTKEYSETINENLCVLEQLIILA